MDGLVDAGHERKSAATSYEPRNGRNDGNCGLTGAGCKFEKLPFPFWQLGRV